MPEANWLSISAYARTYGVDRKTVYKMLEAHALETWTWLGIRRIRNRPPREHHAESTTLNPRTQKLVKP